jgi:hypothetical protein
MTYSEMGRNSFLKTDKEGKVEEVMYKSAMLTQEAQVSIGEFL